MEEQAAILAVSLGGGDINSGVWIGYTDAASEGTWLWADGWSSDYTHWASNEGSGGSESVTHLRREGKLPA